jgi:hypothetical protein
MDLKIPFAAIYTYAKAGVHNVVSYIMRAINGMVYIRYGSKL